MDIGKVKAAIGQANGGEVRIGDLVLRLELPSTARAGKAGVYRVQATAPAREDAAPSGDAAMTPEQAEEFSRRLASAAILEGSTDGGTTWEPWDPKKDNIGALPMVVFTAVLGWVGQAQKEATAQVASFPRG